MFKMRLMFPAVVLGIMIAPASAQDSDRPSDRKVDRSDGASPHDTDTMAPSDDTLPIVVIGDQPAEKSVVTGSRIPRRSTFENGTVATSTGVTSGSGMTPHGQHTRMVRTSSCEASDERISEDVACALIAAKEAIERKEWARARGLLVPLARDDKVSSVEMRAAVDYLYLAAKEADDVSARTEALRLLVQTGTLSDVESASALRSLSSIALNDGDLETAIDYLISANNVRPNDPTTLSRLAILQKRNGNPSAPQTMARAIHYAEQSGVEAPEAWQAFILN